MNTAKPRSLCLLRALARRATRLAKTGERHMDADSKAWHPPQSTLRAAITSSLILVLVASYAAPLSAYGANAETPESPASARSAGPAGPPTDTSPRSGNEAGAGGVGAPEEGLGADGISGPDEALSPGREALRDGKTTPAHQAPATKVGSGGPPSQPASAEVGRLSTSVQSLGRLLPEGSSRDAGVRAARAAGEPPQALSAPEEPASGVGPWYRLALVVVLSAALLGGWSRVLRRRTADAGFGGPARTSAARPL